ncbi:MAG: 2-hydroxyacid dehydrogenase [Dehalococcoidia bacterium]
MRCVMFDTHSYDRQAFVAANARFGHDLRFVEPRLTRDTAQLARGSATVCSFVNDRVDADAIDILRGGGVRLLALRSAGFNHVDLQAAQSADIAVVRVPEYSPHAVAEHAVALLLTLNRKIHRAHNRVRESNFSLDGLVGFDLFGKTCGVVGTGRIGAAFARIMHGFGCRLLAADLSPNAELAAAAGVHYVDLDVLWSEADVISLHVPLTPATRHLISAQALARMKPGVVLLNTSRGALIDTRALIASLKSGRMGAAGLDVYEEEEAVFFRDLSGEVLQDDVLARLMTFGNVLLTSHQGFLTREALANIAETTLASLRAFERGEPLTHQVRADVVLR